mgnify:FL=1
MSEGNFNRLPRRHDEDTSEAFRKELDLLVSDELAGHGFKEESYKQFVFEINKKREELRASGKDDSDYERLAREAEARWLSHRSGDEIATA